MTLLLYHWDLTLFRVDDPAFFPRDLTPQENTQRSSITLDLRYQDLACLLVFDDVMSDIPTPTYVNLLS